MHGREIFYRKPSNKLANSFQKPLLRLLKAEQKNKRKMHEIVLSCLKLASKHSTLMNLACFPYTTKNSKKSLQCTKIRAYTSKLHSKNFNFMCMLYIPVAMLHDMYKFPLSRITAMQHDFLNNEEHILVAFYYFFLSVRVCVCVCASVNHFVLRAL